MKGFFIFSVLVFSSSAMAWDWDWLPWKREDLGPLRMIVLSGSYTPGDERELKEIEKRYRERGSLGENEALKDRYPHFRHGEERFGWTGRLYCHKEIEPEKRGYRFFFNPDVRARLYDEEGNVLEDVEFKSLRYMPTRFTWIIKAYVPYHPSARKQRVVRLEGDKEIVLWERGVSTLEDFHSGKVWMAYSNRSDCYY